MKLHLLDRTNRDNSSFSATINEHTNFLNVWHYHPELELVVVLKSRGSCFIGDGIERFVEGDVVLIGKNLPHMWLNDDSYFKENSILSAKAIAIHFKDDFLGESFFKTPEMIHILELFERGKCGLKFSNVPDSIINEIQEILDLNGFNRTMKFLKVLNKLSKHKFVKKIGSFGYLNSFRSNKSDVQDKVQGYIFKNFNKDISLKDVAAIANMNTSAFSRYFKRVNRKTFSKYLNEIRIGYACKLLIENKYTISIICYESGFNNLSNFNRQFKMIKKITPTEYLNNHSIKSH